MKMSKKTIITTLVIIMVIIAAIFAAYEIGIKFAADKAVNVIIKNEIDNMLENGEITLDEVAQLAEVDTVIEEEPSDVPMEKEPESQKTQEKSPQKPNIEAQTPITPSKKEVVDKAAEKATKEVDTNDKKEVVKLIRSRLSAADMKYLISLLGGGVTKQEISAAAKLAYSRFSAEEIVRVKEFWHKYKSNIKRAPETSKVKK